MADFTIRASSGVTVAQWLDPAETGQASRINSRQGYPQRRVMGTTGVQIEIRAKVAGVEAPLDSALEGRLFVGCMVDHPETTPPVLSWPAAQSSIQRFTPTKPGHYHFRMRRADGGVVHIHFDVEAA